MRILLVTHYYSTHRGGVERVAHRLAEELCVRHGACVDWFASDSDPLPKNRVPGLSLHPVRACNALEERTGMPWPLWSPGCLPGLWRAAGRADCIHIHDYLYLGNLWTIAIATLRRKPLLISQHIGAVPYDRFWLRWALSVLNRTAGLAALARADRVAFVSARVMQYFAAFCSFRSPPAVIANGVDQDTFSFADRNGQIAARRALNLDETVTLLLFVGRFLDMKGLPLLRHVAGHHPEILWLFAGGGVQDPAAWGLPNVAVFRGREGASLAQLYQAADLLVLPSKSEGFPLVIQEAMSCGTPVLGGAEWLRGEKGLEQMTFAEPVLASDSAARWSDRIATLTADPGRLRQMRHAVASWARSAWSWPRCADGYAELLRQLVASRAGPVDV